MKHDDSLISDFFAFLYTRPGRGFGVRCIANLDFNNSTFI